MKSAAHVFPPCCVPCACFEAASGGSQGRQRPSDPPFTADRPEFRVATGPDQRAAEFIAESLKNLGDPPTTWGKPAHLDNGTSSQRRAGVWAAVFRQEVLHQADSEARFSSSSSGTPFRAKALEGIVGPWRERPSGLKREIRRFKAHHACSWSSDAKNS